MNLVCEKRICKYKQSDCSSDKCVECEYTEDCCQCYSCDNTFCSDAEKRVFKREWRAFYLEIGGAFNGSD